MAKAKPIKRAHNFKEMSGEYVYWTVVRFAEMRNQRAYWLCRCRCGTERAVLGKDLTSGKSRSCGCLQREVVTARNFIHGMSKSPEFIAWAGAHTRCYNEQDEAYKDYGSRGVRVCQGWRDRFMAFLEDMGPRPAGCSLDRIDNDGHYSCGKCAECLANGWPANCRWATKKQQNRNRRNAALLAYNGRIQSLAVWVEELALDYHVIVDRLRLGWSVEHAFETTVRRRRR